jgi:hypothetical protein
MERFLNALKAQAAALDQSQGQPRFATVTSVDPASYAAKVTLQPEGVVTGWLPILSPWIGAGWGLVCPPSPGDQVLVLAQEGDADHGVIVGRAFSDAQRPPAGITGELWLVHSTGSFLKLHNDGSVEGQATAWNLTGDLHVTGDIYDRHGSLAAFRGHYDVHVHADPQGGYSAGPTPTD